MTVQPPNPKKLMGDKKPPLHLLPLGGMIHQALAHMDGNLKYGFENWNETPVEKLTYIGAILRHTELYKYGEHYARDTNVHNLGAVMACCAILIDSELNGNLIDNTRHSKATCDLLHNAEAIVDALKEMQRERDAAKVKSNTVYSAPSISHDQSSRERDAMDRSWADLPPTWPADQGEAPKSTYDRLLKDAQARVNGLNLDGTPRREARPLPAWRCCRECTTWSKCATDSRCERAR